MKEPRATCNMVTTEEDIQLTIESAKEAPKELDDSTTQNTIDELKEINLGSEENPRPTFISMSLSPENEGRLTKLMKEYTD